MRDAVRPAIIHGWRPNSRHFGMNARLNRYAKAFYVRDAHERTGRAFQAARWPRSLPGPVVITITIRQQLGKQPDSDGLVSLPKAVRDAVAKWFGVDDGPSGPITWEYAWERGPDEVRIELEER